MSKTNISQDQSSPGTDTPAVKETFKEEKNNPAVNEALKKEKQPATPDDLSELHNNKEVGTSGGDQRASENDVEADKANK